MVEQEAVNFEAVGSSPTLPAIKLEEVMLVNVEDRRKIKSVQFKYPQLFNENAELEVKLLHLELLTLEDNLESTRQLVRNMENELKIKKDNFHTLSSMFTLEFETKEVEHVDRVSSTLGIVNPTDASNRSYTG